MQPLFRETTLSKTDLIAPIFIDETASHPVSIDSMPGQYRYPLSSAGEVAGELWDLGIGAAVLFGIPKHKDAEGSAAWADDGVIQRALCEVKEAAPSMVAITDVCACEYTDHGHCGIIGECGGVTDLLNDPSLALMAKIAVSHAEHGADIVAPSCMLDGMVRTLRNALDMHGFDHIPIMSYSSKFSSALYGPFRDAADSGYTFGDRSTYQIDPSNAREAVLESVLDMEEGADILMVKPAGLYLDIIASVRELGIPVAAYQVSGEYAMIKAAAENGWIDEKNLVLESLTCIKRAGADMIITYFAADMARWMNEK
jgi:porphobilinogen synthase